MPRVVSLETRQRQSRAQLSRKQLRFCEEYAHLGNASEAARRAGYKASDRVGQIAHENLKKPAIIAEIARLDAELQLQVTPQRVQRRLDTISRAAQAAGQYGPAVRAEELLGKSIGMWIDQTLQLNGVLNDSHVTALLQLARERQAQPIDLADTATDAVSDGTAN